MLASNTSSIQIDAIAAAVPDDVDRIAGCHWWYPPYLLTPEQFEEFFALLEDGQPGTPQEIDDLLWDRYGVTYDRAHLAQILRADGMEYAKPRPMDPRKSPDAEADFRERLGEGLTKDTGDEPLVLGFFDASWLQPFANSQCMWSYDRTVEIDKPLVTVPW